MPLRSYFDGTPVPGASDFGPETYRALLNLVLDQIWTPGDAWGPTECSRVLSFFVDQGIGKYVGSYELDGTATTTMREVALVLVNGATAVPVPMSFPADSRRAFVEAVWEMPVPTGDVRYYQGMMQLFALLVLSGKMQVL
jgi:oligosaccharide reducing-end xylanase